MTICTRRIEGVVFCLALLTAVFRSGTVVGEQVPERAEPMTSEQKKWYAELLKAWKARETETHTFRIGWVEERTVKKGSQTRLFPEGDAPPTYPREDQEIINKRSLILKDSSIFYQADEQIFSVGKDDVTLVPEVYRSVFGGVEPRRLIERKNDGTFSGYIDEGERFSDSNDTPVFPALLNVRGLNKRLGLGSPSKFHPLPGFENVSKIECRVLEAAYPTSTRRYFVNPRAAYRIEKFEVIHLNGDVAYEIDFSYDSDAPPAGGALIGWTTVSFRGDKVTEVSRAVVKRHEVGIPLEDKAFELAFPPGTRVLDRRRGREFLVLPDGSERIIPER